MDADATRRDIGYPATPGIAAAVQRLTGAYDRHEEGMARHRRKLARDHALRKVGELVAAAAREGATRTEGDHMVVRLDRDIAGTLLAQAEEA